MPRHPMPRCPSVDAATPSAYPATPAAGVTVGITIHRNSLRTEIAIGIAGATSSPGHYWVREVMTRYASAPIATIRTAIKMYTSVLPRGGAANWELIP